MLIRCFFTYSIASYVFCLELFLRLPERHQREYLWWHNQSPKRGPWSFRWMNSIRFSPLMIYNSCFYQLGAITGALFIGYVLDIDRFNRRTRGYIGLALVVVITITVWSAALAWQVSSLLLSLAWLWRLKNVRQCRSRSVVQTFRIQAE